MIKATSKISWWLTDATESQQRSPYTFYKPSNTTIGQLITGSLVKLIFEFDDPDPDVPSAERMWVKVRKIDGGRFLGELDNVPHHIKTLQLGACVEFESRHIIQTDIDEVAPDLVQKYLPRCFVTRKVLYDGEKVGRAYREEPEGENDSGWRILAGNETEEYMDDEENVFFVSLGAVLNKDDSFVHLLTSAVGTTYERDLDTGKFKKID